MKKKIVKSILAILAIVMVNGCYYVFSGQFRSVDKLRDGKDLSLYEKCSIYSMHLAICTVGWVFSPEATRSIVAMSFPCNRGKTIREETDFFLHFPAVEKTYRTQYSRKKIAFNGDISYSLFNPDHRLALAVNPGYLWRDEENVYLESPIHYPVCYDTHIGLLPGVSITVNECLFSYLETKRWLHPYTIVYYSRINES